jgi:glycine/D-amino acid oxidase-like deaminating enzyme
MSAAERIGYEPISGSQWTEFSPPAQKFAVLEEQLECDVGVIGAGYTGLISALALAEKGQRVVVLEAEQPGWGASGRNAGQVIPMMWGSHKTAAFVAGKVPGERGAKLNAAVANAGKGLFELVARHQIVCDARQGYVCVVRSEKTFRKWQQNFSKWREYGGRFEELDRAALREYVDSPRYEGGFFLPDGGQLNPYAFSQGLAAAVVRHGSRIFGGSRARAVVKDGNGWRIEAGRGAVRCRTVLVGAGGYADGLFPILGKIGIPIAVGVAVTSPLLDDGKSILPAHLPMADIDDPAVFSPTLDANGALVVSYLIGTGLPSLERAAKVVGRRLERAFPSLKQPAMRRIWAGRFLVTSDGMPALWRLDENIYAAMGCNGLGHTLGVLAAQELAKVAAGVSNDQLLLPPQEPHATPGAGVMPSIMRGVLFPMLNRLGA